MDANQLNELAGVVVSPIVSTVSVISFLRSRYPAVSWSYNRRAQQWESSGGATVCWVAACSSYCDNSPCSHAPQLWLYGHGTPERLWLAEVVQHLDSDECCHFQD
jgi:hypothetical protein